MVFTYVNVTCIVAKKWKLYSHDVMKTFTCLALDGTLNFPGLKVSLRVAQGSVMQVQARSIFNSSYPSQVEETT